MKKIVLIAVVLLSFRAVYAQTAEPPAEEADLYSTRAERFSDSTGALIQKEYIRVGNIFGCVIDVVHYKDLMKGTKVSALRFSDALGKVAILDEEVLPEAKASR